LTAVLGACGMFAVKEQQQKLDAFCRFGGQVAGERSGLAAFVVVLARRSGDSWQIADHFVREGPGPWQLVASAGTYGVVAFQDLNRDLKLQPDEPYLALDERRQFECKAGEQYTDLALRIPAAGRARFAGTLDISALQVRSFSDQLNLSVGQVTAVGEVVSLSDPRFDEKVAEDGLWRPFDFLFKGRPGIYFLEPYDAKKLPVLFVHGINGTPANFRPLIEHLDRQRFQPWVYYYPSGARLPNVADHLAQTMRKLQRQYGFRSVAVVAHSMGGLVSRGFLLRYHESGDATVPLFVSIATPWDGHAGAAVGVKTAPAVVRVWVDMAPGSEYLQSLYAADPGVPHYLLFTYRQGGVSLGEASDGTVTVASQLRMAAQQGAARVEGYNETHMSVLESQAVSQRLNELLAHVAQRQ
ncbi:MAG TPA: alpha/beta fold hydrolase, partial [Burkholderiales bacterium]|nr:alpha/beta fold hydrolase [Burkholderiales bacterium]